jgi:hypothetical protein
MEEELGGLGGGGGGRTPRNPHEILKFEFLS